jgi:hypothetical protein
MINRTTELEFSNIGGLWKKVEDVEEQNSVEQVI